MDVLDISPGTLPASSNLKLESEIFVLRLPVAGQSKDQDLGIWMDVHLLAPHILVSGKPPFLSAHPSWNLSWFKNRLSCFPQSLPVANWWEEMAGSGVVSVHTDLDADKDFQGS